MAINDYRDWGLPIVKEPRQFATAADVGTYPEVPPVKTEKALAAEVQRLIDERIVARLEVVLGLLIDSDEELALATAVLAHAGHRGAWLVYSDWLEEHGRLRQAERLREAVRG